MSTGVKASTGRGDVKALLRSTHCGKWSTGLGCRNYVCFHRDAQRRDQGNVELLLLHLKLVQNIKLLICGECALLYLRYQSVCHFEAYRKSGSNSRWILRRESIDVSLHRIIYLA